MSEQRHQSEQRRESEAVWALVNALGALERPVADPARVSSLVRQLGPAAAFDQLVAHRVYTPALRQLSGLSADGSAPVNALRERLAELQRTEESRRERVRDVTWRTLRDATAHGARVIKGLALRTYYRQPELRHEGDIDLHVPTWPAARRVAKELRAHGWLWDTSELPWLKWTDGGSLYGQLSLVLRGPDEEDARVDLHIGPYSVGHGGLLPLVGWQDSEILDVPLQVPSTEVSLALIGAHASNDAMLSQKDVNDVAQIIARSDDIDWGSVEELSASVGAADIIRQIRSQAVAQRAAAGTEAAVPMLDGPLGACGPAGIRRALRFGVQALVHELRRGDPFRAAPRAAEAVQYFNADLAPRLADGHGETMATATRGRTSCWRMIPASVWTRWSLPIDQDGTGGERNAAGPGNGEGSIGSEQLAEDLVLLTRRGFAAVRAIGEVFVPTVSGRVAAGSVELARDLVQP